jgi:hypothetical protein
MATGRSRVRNEDRKGTCLGKKRRPRKPYRLHAKDDGRKMKTETGHDMANNGGRSRGDLRVAGMTG